VTAVSTFPLRVPRWRVVRSLIAREYASKRTYRLAFVLDLLFGIANLFVYYFISRTLGAGNRADLGDAPTYFAFALVGIAITNVIGAASTGLAYRIREEQFTGTLEAVLVQPVTLGEVSIGLAGYPFLFSMARAALYIVIGGTLLGVSFANAAWLGFCVMLFCSALAFGSLGIILGGIILVVKRGEALVGVAMYTLGILGGAFFPISALPSWLETIANLLPTHFAFHGLRSAIFLGRDWEVDAVALLAFAAVGLPLASYLFRRAVDHTRRAGTLSQY
jgi:ABC-2 type transport system permease protein